MMESNNSNDVFVITYITKSDEIDEIKNNGVVNNSHPSKLAITELFHRPLISARKLTNYTDDNRAQEVYDVAIEFTSDLHKFEPGDTIGILPHNNCDEINEILILLNLLELSNNYFKLSINTDVAKKTLKLPVHIPTDGVILREVFERSLDLRSVPKKLFLKGLMLFTTNEAEIEKLRHFSSPPGSADYLEFIQKDGNTFLKLLKAFPSCKPNLSFIFQHLPSLKPRPYSISSSPVETDKFHITYSVRSGEKRGICTGYLETIREDLSANIKPNELALQNLTLNNKNEVSFYFGKQNNFRLPVNKVAAIILISAGTGIAPFIGFLKHLQLLKIKSFSWLFFGCRYSKQDFLYETELNEFLSDKTLTKLTTAFSRDGNDKVYVQDKIKEFGEELTEKVLKENAIIYVCGEAKNMMVDVKKSVTSCLQNFGEFSEETSAEYIKDMVKENRYVEDNWG